MIFAPGGDEPGSLASPISRAEGVIRLGFLYPDGVSGADERVRRASSGQYDYRRESSIAAMRGVVLYAAGQLPDSSGRSISYLAPVAVQTNNISPFHQNRDQDCRSPEWRTTLRQSFLYNLYNPRGSRHVFCVSVSSNGEFSPPPGRLTMKSEVKDRGMPDRGRVEIGEEECKGCGLCVEACPVEVLNLSERFNSHGYHPAEYAGEGCTGCGVCFFACPEPGAITVLRLARKA